MSVTRPPSPGLSPLSRISTWSYSRNGRVARISIVQKMFDSTLHAAKKATAATAAKPVNAVHSTVPETPSRCSTSRIAAAEIRNVSTRREPITSSGGAS